MAKGKKFDIPDELKKKIDNTINDAMDEMAYEFVAEIEEGYQDVITAFYEDYTPKYYKRTEYLRMASSGNKHFKTVVNKDEAGTIVNSMKFRDRNVHKYKTGGYRIGIRVSSSYIPRQPYKRQSMVQEDGVWKPGKKYGADKEWVFNRAFERGIHGFSKEDAKLWGIWTLNKTQNSRSQNNYNWSVPIRNAPPIMKPTPKQKMDDWFNKYKKNTKHLDEVCRRCMSDSFRRNFKR